MSNSTTERARRIVFAIAGNVRDASLLALGLTTGALSWCSTEARAWLRKRQMERRLRALSTFEPKPRRRTRWCLTS